MRVKYLKDDNNNDILQDDSGKYQVMMEWEKDYMIELINKLKPTGKVLEIGFGFGYSANAIIQNDITDYTIIECSPEVWKRIEQFKKDNPNKKINLIKGRWEDVLYTSEKYDTIFFDDYSYENDLTRFDNFLKKVVKNHTNIGSRIGVYSTNPQVSNKFECLSLECEKYNVDIPKDCNYASGKCMYIPIYTKISEMTKEDENKKLNIGKLATTSFIAAPSKIESTPITCNMIIIDNFYSNPTQVRDYALSLDYNENYSMCETNDSIKETFQQYLSKQIINFDTTKNNINKNGSFKYTTIDDTCLIKTNTNWSGIIFLTPNAPIESGLGIYKHMSGMRYHNEHVKDNHKDVTKWKLVDKIGNVFNRLVLFNSKQYHMDMINFGQDKINGKLCQVFSFDCVS